MSVIFIVLPLAIAFAALAVWGFVHAARHGQYDDLDTPAVRMLLDDEPQQGTTIRSADPRNG